jgi:hypothetical protein
MSQKTSIAFAICAVAAQLLSGTTTAQATPSTRLGIYEEFVTANCASSGCFVFFATVPADTIINTVSCNFYINAGPSSLLLTGIALGQASTATAASFRAAQYVNVPYANYYTNTLSQFEFLANTQHVVPQSMKPAIQIGYNTTATGVANCLISGATSTFLPALSPR